MLRLSKIFSAFLVLLSFTCTSLKAQEVKNGLTWYTDINKAYEQSEQVKKPIFAFFTGSDWCGWCHRLEQNVFEKRGFQDWAKANVILLELDFPRNKKLPEDLMNQNAGLQQFFNVQGYPTIWMFTMSRDTVSKKFAISALGTLGYPESQPGAEERTFLANANKILKNK